MEAQISPLLPLFAEHRAAGRPLALAVVARTTGSTYRKPGALMAIAADGRYAGLLSGGCLENDLREHAREVIETGRARLLAYDTGGTDDLLWGLGLGCEGAMQVLLLRVGAPDWQPLAHLRQALAARRRTAVGLALESQLADFPAGSVVLPEGSDPPSSDPPMKAPFELQDAVQALMERARDGGRALELSGTAPVKVLAVPLALPPRLLLLGGGPDARPVVDIAARLGFEVSVYDHRPAYAQVAQFQGAREVVNARPDELARHLDLASFDAAVVMSHHLPSDLGYLRALAHSAVGYVGLLGPPNRREKLLGDLGADAPRLVGRLRSPVGLDLGGRTPEAIALSIVAEVHAVVHGATGAHRGDTARR
ncbi:MAG TPA: XdhC family protein [Steroidobacteraceae bacterium]|nr:XdhC family protein [Steroidobacteraceae bacterium]